MKRVTSAAVMTAAFAASAWCDTPPSQTFTGLLSATRETAAHDFTIPANTRAILSLDELEGDLYQVGITLRTSSGIPPGETWYPAANWITETGHVFNRGATEDLEATLHINRYTAPVVDYTFNLVYDRNPEADIFLGPGFQMLEHRGELTWDAYPYPNGYDYFPIGQFGPETRIEARLFDVHGLETGWHLIPDGDSPALHHRDGVFLGFAFRPGDPPAESAELKPVTMPKRDWASLTAFVAADESDSKALVHDVREPGEYSVVILTKVGATYGYSFVARTEDSPALKTAACAALADQIAMLDGIRASLVTDWFGTGFAKAFGLPVPKLKAVFEGKEEYEFSDPAHIQTSGELIHHWLKGFDGDVLGTTLRQILAKRHADLQGTGLSTYLVPSNEAAFPLSTGLADRLYRVTGTFDHIQRSYADPRFPRVPEFEDAAANHAMYRWLRDFHQTGRRGAISDDLLPFLNNYLVKDLAFPIDPIPFNASDEAVQEYLARNALELLAYVGAVREFEDIQTRKMGFDESGANFEMPEGVNDEFDNLEYRKILATDFAKTLDELRAGLVKAQALFTSGECGAADDGLDSRGPGTVTTSTATSGN